MLLTFLSIHPKVTIFMCYKQNYSRKISIISEKTIHLQLLQMDFVMINTFFVQMIAP